MSQSESLSSRRILIVEIKTVESDVYDDSQLHSLTIYQDSNSCYLAKGIEVIKSAILSVIPRLGSNYKHPLLFDVQVLPGDGTDAIVASTERSPKRKRKTSRIR